MENLLFLGVPILKHIRVIQLPSSAKFSYFCCSILSAQSTENSQNDKIQGEHCHLRIFHIKTTAFGIKYWLSNKNTLHSKLGLLTKERICPGIANSFLYEQTPPRKEAEYSLINRPHQNEIEHSCTLSRKEAEHYPHKNGVSNKNTLHSKLGLLTNLPWDSKFFPL